MKKLVRKIIPLLAKRDSLFLALSGEKSLLPPILTIALPLALDDEFMLLSDLDEVLDKWCSECLEDANANAL